MSAKFAPFAPAVDPSFWEAWSLKKLDDWRLTTGQKIKIDGKVLADPAKVAFSYAAYDYEANSEAKNANVGAGASSPSSTSQDFKPPARPDVSQPTCLGVLRNVDTIEEFKAYDR